MNALTKSINVSDDVNIFVVGDVHGDYIQLMEELSSIGFNFNTDLLIGVGDTVDRGVDNLKCASLLQEDWFTSIKGNHEDFCCKGLYDDRFAFYHKMPNNGGSWFYELPEDYQKEMVKVFNKLPILLDVKWRGRKFGFVHADVPIQDWDWLVEAVNNEDNLPHEDRTVVEACLWSRNVVFRDHVHVAGIDRVFLGHTVLPSIKNVGNCTFLDTGGVFKHESNDYKLSIVKLEDYV